MKTIIDTATEAGGFATLLSAISAASLTDTLRGTGPFTVFAPTDAAFRQLPAGTLESLLKDLPKLTALLKYHVTTGRLESTEMHPGDLRTLEGSPIAVTVQGKDVQLNGSRVARADISASNGIIHVIDQVLMPRSQKRAAVA